MTDWEGVLRRPADFQDGPVAEEWFGRIAGQLLNGARLVAGGEPHRFVEVEVYYHDGGAHPDPFAHRDPVQRECGRWYFHRTGGVYRSGSFKGLDLTFGDGRAHGGVLIRSIEAPGGKLIDGPSLCVDHLLAATGAGTVAELDRAIGGRKAWDPDSPLRLAAVDPPEQRPVVRTGRVGLSLKRLRESPDPPRFILRRYRYLTEPRRVSKGKPYLVLALHREGQDPDAIRQLTGCPRASIQRYLEDYKAGQAETAFTGYFGIDLGPKDLCRLHGTWRALMEPPA